MEKISFFEECWNRFKKPWCGSFLTYFIFIIALFSAGGVISSIISRHQEVIKVNSIAANMSTYFLALLLPATIKILLSFFSIINKVSLVIWVVIIIVFGTLLLYLSYSLKGNIVLIPAAIGVVFSWFFWVIANYDDENLNDTAFDKKIKREIKATHGGGWDE